jgi:uncharacterized phage protein (TIGR01671 family)
MNKFRGKRVDNGEWAFGYYYIDLENKLSYIMLSERKETAEDWMLKSVQVAPETVGRFSTIHDKDGKEIYEGDKVKQRYFEDLFVCFGEYNDGKCNVVGFYWSDSYPFGRCSDENTYEVIGNIHENESSPAQ